MGPRGPHAQIGQGVAVFIVERFTHLSSDNHSTAKECDMRVIIGSKSTLLLLG